MARKVDLRHPHGRRIFHIVNNISPNGAYGGPLTVAVNQVKAMIELGHDAILVAGSTGFSKCPPSQYAGVPVILFAAHRVIPKSGYAGLCAPGLLNWLRTEIKSTDIVHIHLARDLITLPAANIVRLMGISYVVQTHGMIDGTNRILAKMLDRRLTVPAIKSASAVICLTDHEVKQVSDIVGTPLETVVLPNTVSEDIVQDRAKQVRSEVLFVGRLHEYKRPTLFVQMAIALSAEFPSIAFTLIGPDEGEAREVERLITESDAQDRIKWIGAIESGDIPDRMRGATLCISTSINESFGMSIIESLAVGVPVVIGDHYPIAEQGGDVFAGAQYDGTLDDLIVKVRGLLSNPRRIADLARNGQNLVRHNYVRSVTISILEGIYMQPTDDRLRKVVIVQPYVPKYRVPFFQLLSKRLNEMNIELVVAAGSPIGVQARRGDAASPPWVQYCSRRVLKICGREIEIGGFGTVLNDADAVIVGHVGSSLTTYRALLSRIIYRNRKVGVWGHIRSYVNDPNPVDARLELWQLKVADHVFAYTLGGGAYAVDHGVKKNALTVVRNTIDTTALISARDKVQSEHSGDVVSKMGLDGKKIFFFVGGLDASKRISFIVEVLNILSVLDESVHLIVAGEGDERDLLDDAVSRGQVTLVGHADDAMKATMAGISNAIVMPGRIGLVAVEGIVLNIPIITSDYKYHAPEYEYLTEGKNLYTVENGPAAFARFLCSFRAEKENEVGEYPKLEEMVDNFAFGIETMML